MEKLKEILVLHPHYGYLMVAALFAFYLIGLILDWEWTLEPGGGLFNIAYWCETFGRKNVRIFLGFFMLLGMASCTGLFLYFNFKS